MTQCWTFRPGHINSSEPCLSGQVSIRAKHLILSLENLDNVTPKLSNPSGWKHSFTLEVRGFPKYHTWSQGSQVRACRAHLRLLHLRQVRAPHPRKGAIPPQNAWHLRHHAAQQTYLLQDVSCQVLLMSQLWLLLNHATKNDRMSVFSYLFLHAPTWDAFPDLSLWDALQSKSWNLGFPSREHYEPAFTQPLYSLVIRNLREKFGA